MPVQLLLTYDFPPMAGGIARWMGELARRYPAGSLVVSTGEHPNSADVDAEFPNRVERLPISARRLRSLQGLVLWSRRTEMMVKALNVEFIWCGNLKPAGYPARWAAVRQGVRYGILLHGGDLLILAHQIRRSLFKRRAARALLGSASVLVANSSWTAAQCRTMLTQLGLDVSPDRVRTVPLGADPVAFRPGIDQTEVRRRYGLEQRRWLLSVARLTRHKGIDVALMALAQLCKDHADIGYVVVGAGDDLPALEALARSLSVSDRVRFLTEVPDRDLPALYNCAEIYLGLSRELDQRVEGFGISLVEAAGCGLPVVAGRSGGVSESVREGETGLLVNPERPEEVALAVRSLLEDRAWAHRLGAGGRRAVEGYYNWPRVAADVARIGQELGRANSKSEVQ